MKHASTLMILNPSGCWFAKGENSKIDPAAEAAAGLLVKVGVCSGGHYKAGAWSCWIDAMSIRKRAHGTVEEREKMTVSEGVITHR